MSYFCFACTKSLFACFLFCPVIFHFTAISLAPLCSLSPYPGHTEQEPKYPIFDQHKLKLCQLLVNTWTIWSFSRALLSKRDVLLVSIMLLSTTIIFWGIISSVLLQPSQTCAFFTSNRRLHTQIFYSFQIISEGWPVLKVCKGVKCCLKLRTGTINATFIELLPRGEHNRINCK